ncbi:MAG: stage II sporulation protein D [Aristaeellaceae bacterium]
MAVRRRYPSLGLCRLLLLLACLWTLCGAPLTGEQWAGIPMQLRRIALQLPGRMKQILLLWHTPAESVISRAEAETRQVDLTLNVWDAKAQAVRRISLEEYVLGVVAAEMPAAYATEALKCQAVAARTRAIRSCRSLGGNGCATHPACDICTDSACCQGYLTRAEQQAKWGGEYTACLSRIRSAVRATAGQILTYDGLPIQVLYHASSGGMTEDAQAVFSEALPYLVHVESPGEEHASCYRADRTYPLEEAAALLEEAFPGCGVTAEGLPGQLRLQSSTASGRIATILVGTQTVTGQAFRQALKLCSTWITWDAEGDSITFHTLGYGHGVGMSQAGAQAMAASGSRYTDILAHYYPGTQLSLLPALHEEDAPGSN